MDLDSYSGTEDSGFLLNTEDEWESVLVDNYFEHSEFFLDQWYGIFQY